MKRLPLILTKSNLNLKQKGGWGGGTVAAAAVAPRLRPPSFTHSHSSTSTHPIPLTAPVLCSCSPAPTSPLARLRLPVCPPLARSCLFRPAHPCLFPFVPVHVASIRTRLCSHAPLIRACSRLRLAFVRACSCPLGCLPV